MESEETILSQFKEEAGVLTYRAGNEFCAYGIRLLRKEIQAYLRAKGYRKAVISWPDCERPYEILSDFRFTSAENQPHGGDRPELERLIDSDSLADFEQRHPDPTPYSKEEELLARLRQSKDPTGICLLWGSMKVLWFNDRMLEFTSQQFDTLIGASAKELFDLRQERAGCAPTDVITFHEELIATPKNSQGKRIIQTATLDAFRSSGAFGTFHLQAEAAKFHGLPVRISTYSDFELKK